MHRYRFRGWVLKFVGGRFGSMRVIQPRAAVEWTYWCRSLEDRDLYEKWNKNKQTRNSQGISGRAWQDYVMYEKKKSTGLEAEAPFYSCSLYSREPHTSLWVALPPKPFPSLLLLLVSSSTTFPPQCHVVTLASFHVFKQDKLFLHLSGLPPASNIHLVIWLVLSLSLSLSRQWSVSFMQLQFEGLSKSLFLSHVSYPR